MHTYVEENVKTKGKKMFDIMCTAMKLAALKFTGISVLF